MPWFKVDDAFATHPKVLAIPRRDRPAAIGLWTLAGTWCAQQLTNGALGQHLIAEFGATKKSAEWLTTVGLWDPTDSGFQFHDWEEWQPTREAVEAERAAARERMRSARSRRSSPEHTANGARTSPEVRQPAFGNVAVTPSRPVPSRPTSEGAKRATRLPADFAVTEPMQAWAIDNHLGKSLTLEETERFKDWHTAKGSTFKDWTAAWRTWMRRVQPDDGGLIDHRPEWAR